MGKWKRKQAEGVGLGASLEVASRENRVNNYSAI